MSIVSAAASAAASSAPISAPIAAGAGASAASAAAWTDSLRPFTADAIANGFATLVGAMCGAMLAYVFQRLFQRSQEHKAAQLAAHRLMFSLLQQINTIVLIQRDYVFEHLKSPIRFISIPATPQFDPHKNTLQIESLAFLLDNSKGRKILYDFYIAQENYIEAIHQWNLRSILHHQQLQPALAASGMHSGATVSLEDIQRELGPMLFGSMVNSTNNVLETLRRAFGKLSAAKQLARQYVVERFKSNDFTDFEFPDTFGLVDSEPKAEAKR